jgi:hypothetical protein
MPRLLRIVRLLSPRALVLIAASGLLSLGLVLGLSGHGGQIAATPQHSEQRQTPPETGASPAPDTAYATPSPAPSPSDAPQATPDAAQVAYTSGRGYSTPAPATTFAAAPSGGATPDPGEPSATPPPPSQCHVSAGGSCLVPPQP